jgi:hypothetical protein
VFHRKKRTGTGSFLAASGVDRISYDGHRRIRLPYLGRVKMTRPLPEGIPHEVTVRKPNGRWYAAVAYWRPPTPPPGTKGNGPVAVARVPGGAARLGRTVMPVGTGRMITGSRRGGHTGCWECCGRQGRKRASGGCEWGDLRGPVACAVAGAPPVGCCVGDSAPSRYFGGFQDGWSSGLHRGSAIG